jgi:DNA-binding NtrC family response regulator
MMASRPQKKSKKEKPMNNAVHDPIFVVDDDQGILDSFDAMLGDDYPLIMIDNGTKAIELIVENKPKLLFLDIKLPGHDGMEVLEKIREKGISSKVVIVTALVQDHYEELAQKYGVFKYLHKPLDVDEVKEITRRVLH